MRLDFSIHIERPPADVFPFVANLENDPKWQRAVIEVRKFTAGPLATGSRFRHTVTMIGSRRLLDIEFVRYVPGRLFVTQCTMGSLVFRTEVRFTKVAHGTQLAVLVEGNPSGVLRLAAVTLSNHRRREIEADLGTLKRLMEVPMLRAGQ